MSSAHSALWLRLVQIAVAWAIVAGLVWTLSLLQRLIERRLARWRDRLRDSRDDQNFRLKLLFAARMRSLLSFGYKAAAVVLFLMMFSAATTFTLKQFSDTEYLATGWIDWIRDPFKAMLSAFVGYLPNLGFLLVWFSVVYWFIRVLKALGRWIEQELVVVPGFPPEWAEPTYRIAVFLVVAFALVVAFPYLPGGSSPAFQGVSIFLGVLISIGSGSAMGNAISGILLTYTRSFHIGDRVKIGDQTGDVMARSMFVTRIRTIKNEEVFIPNSQILSNYVVNYSQGKRAGGLILYTTITIGYDAPWREVHQLLIDAALRTRGILHHPAPFVFQTALNDYNVSYQINAYTDSPHEMPDIYSALHQHIQDCFNEGGVEIMSPAYHSLRDGNTTTTPASYMPPDYQPPGFRVTS